MKTAFKATLLVLALAAAALGCERSAAVSPASADESVTKIVFVGKDKPCDCTRKRIDATWAALEMALGTPPRLPVEKLAMDAQPDQVKPYHDQKPMMVIPGIYLVNAKGSVVNLLEGEVTAEQITAALAGR
jgi:hypothetical protein